MTNKVYLDNVKRTIKKQIEWAGVEGEDKAKFIEDIINHCGKLLEELNDGL